MSQNTPEQLEHYRRQTQSDAVAIRVEENGEILLCLRMEQNAELLQSAHNILDEALGRFAHGVARTDLQEEDASRTVTSYLRGQTIWHESFANKLFLVSERGRSGACGMGSNQRHRKRVTSLAMAMLLVCQNTLNPQCSVFLSTSHLLMLGRICMAAYNQPLTSRVAGTQITQMAPPVVTTITAAMPPRPAPTNAAEELQYLARTLGVDEEVVNDPYLVVHQDKDVMCAACNKFLTAAHTESKKHKGYLGNIEDTLRWLQMERPEWVCLRMLELNFPAPRRRAAPSVPSQPRAAQPGPPPPGPAGPPGPAAPPGPQYWPSSPPGRSSPSSPDPSMFPMPTDEEIFTFLMTLSGRIYHCKDARWFSSEDPQPIRWPGRGEEDQDGPDPTRQGRRGRVIDFDRPAEEEEEEGEVEEV